jgi:hypothetical protein
MQAGAYELCQIWCTRADQALPTFRRRFPKTAALVSPGSYCVASVVRPRLIRYAGITLQVIDTVLTVFIIAEVEQKIVTECRSEQLDECAPKFVKTVLESKEREKL